MIHCLGVESRIAGDAPLQVAVSEKSPSASLIKIVYLMIGSPFVIGSVHEILTVLLMTSVAGARGIDGTVAHRILTPSLLAL